MMEHCYSNDVWQWNTIGVYWNWSRFILPTIYHRMEDGRREVPTRDDVEDVRREEIFSTLDVQQIT